jgi:selenide,water dikinase
MGGIPFTAMNIVCFPMDGAGGADPEWLVKILLGGADKVAESGALLLGGHTVADETIKFGLSVTGIAHPREIVATKGAKPGDYLVLTKALGTGMVTTAIKLGIVTPEHEAAAIASMTLLNAAAARAMVRVGVHAATDVTGFGLLGHLHEMLEYSGVSAELDASALPLLPGAYEYAAQGVDTGGGKATAAFLREHTTFASEVPMALRAICTDPQTSGGLLMAVPAERLERLREELEREGVNVRAVIGRVGDGPAGTVRIRAGDGVAATA